MSRKWEYNGITLEVDLQDADFAERYEKAFKQLAEEEKIVPRTGELANTIRQYCKMFFNLFDNIYGPGTSEKLFGGKMNSGLVEEAYAAFIDASNEDVKEGSAKRNSFTSKYAPSSNREQRRYSQSKHHRKRNKWS